MRIVMRITGKCQSGIFYSSICYDTNMARPGRVPAEQLAALRERIKMLMLQGVSLSEISQVVGLSEETVRKHSYVIKKSWVDPNEDPASNKQELIERANLVAKMAAAAAARAKGSSNEAQFLKIQLEVIDRIARLTGAYEPDRTEITGKDGAAIQLAAVPHEIDTLAPAQLAARLQAWADSMKEEPIEGKAEIVE
jgi:hypothetical protein